MVKINVITFYLHFFSTQDPVPYLPPLYVKNRVQNYILLYFY